MGFFKKAFRPIAKIAKKIIPKEIRPFLPYIAAGMVGPAGLGSNFMSGITNQALRQALAAGVTSAATDEDGNPLRAAGLAAAPALFSQGVGALAGSGGPNTGEGLAGFLNKTKTLKDNTETVSLVDRISSMANPETLGGQLKLGAAQTSVDQAAKFAELNQEEIDKYNQSLLSEGMADKGSRRNAIYQIYMNTGAYEADDVNSMLDKYGYASGGRVNLAGGGLEELMLDMDTGRFPKGSGKSITRKFKNQVPTIDELISEEEEMDPKDKIIETLTSQLGEDEEETEYKKFERALDTGSKGLAALGKSGHSMEPVPMLRFATGGEVIEESETLMAGGPYGSGRDVQDAFSVWSGMGSDDKSLFEGFLDFYKQGSWRDQIMGQADVEENTMMASLETGQQNTLENIYEDLLADGLSPDAAAKKAMEIFRNMGKAEGGIMNRNLLNTGVDKDMRGGGFIPEGTKEKADDVPARLSKNEFVMTADAVKAAGGGSVNKGAQRMYNIMNQLEAQV